MPKRKRETTSQMIRREMVEKLRKIKTSSGKIEKLKSKVKASTGKKKETWVAKLKKEVKAEFAARKKKTSDTVRTKDTQHQLKEAGVKFKTDAEKRDERKRKKK